MRQISQIPKNISQHIVKKYVCKSCDYTTSNKTDFNKHNLTRKHIKNDKLDNSQNVSQNTAKKYVCELCNYITIKKTDFNKHILTRKHTTNVNASINYKNDPPASTIVINEPTLAATNLITPELVVDLLKDNKEMKQIIIDLVKNGTNNITNNTNCNNKTSFNLNFFLNETCKDAMNINDFIKSIKLTVTDLMKLGDLGYVEGITKVITSNLNALDINQRPLHCSDKKRETIYIKDEDKWEKDGDKTKIINVINTLSKSHVDLLPEYRKTYPDCQNADSKLSDSYNKMIIEAMGGPGDNEKENKDKIVRNIVKCATIEKLQNATSQELECM
jgi:rubredoxin